MSGAWASFSGWFSSSKPPPVAKQLTHDGRDEEEEGEEEKVETRPHLVSPSPKRIKTRPSQDNSDLENEKEESQAVRLFNESQAGYQDLDSEEEEEEEFHSHGVAHVPRSASREKVKRDIFARMDADSAEEEFFDAHDDVSIQEDDVKEKGYLICAFADILECKAEDRLIYENILLCRSDKAYPASSSKCVKDGVAIGCGFCIPHQTPYVRDSRLFTPDKIRNIPYRAHELIQHHWALNRCGCVPMQVVESAKKKYNYQFSHDALAIGLNAKGVEDDVAVRKVKIGASAHSLHQDNSNYHDNEKEERRVSRSKRQAEYQDLDSDDDDDEEAQWHRAALTHRAETAPSRKKVRRDDQKDYLICTFADILTCKPKDRLIYENILFCRSDKAYPASSSKRVKDGVAIGCGFCIPQTPYARDYRLCAPKKFSNVPFRVHELMKFHWAPNRCSRVPMQVVESAKGKNKLKFSHDDLEDGLKAMGMKDDSVHGVKID